MTQNNMSLLVTRFYPIETTVTYVSDYYYNNEHDAQSWLLIINGELGVSGS